MDIVGASLRDAVFRTIHYIYRTLIPTGFFTTYLITMHPTSNMYDCSCPRLIHKPNSNSYKIKITTYHSDYITCRRHERSVKSTN